MTVVAVEPGMAPYEKEINGLREMQALVGGPIYPIKERFREIELFGVPALFTDKRAVCAYPGFYRYELQSGRITQDAGDGFLGTVLTLIPIAMPQGRRELEAGDLFLDVCAGYYTPEEFGERYGRCDR